MLRHASSFLLLFLFACSGSANQEPSILRDVECVRSGDEIPADVWESAIVAYEVVDVEDPPDPGSIVFVGSSSILFWGTLSDDMAPMPVLNRGFGGSVIAHSTHFADRIVLPYQPRAVVMYAGDNDIALRMITSRGRGRSLRTCDGAVSLPVEISNKIRNWSPLCGR